MTRRAFVAGLVAILLAGATLRVLWLRADPPTSAVGIVWHDEGAWVHNARNRALWGVWRTDEWNPVFIAPVFTALEYAAFKTAGVGTWQARTVPLVSGLAAILLVAAGVARLAGSRAGLIAGALLATNYVFVMWNRAALMESTMTAFIVAGWAFYSLAERRAAWGLAAGVAAVLAWFTKAAAAFFIAAIVIEILISLWQNRRARFAWWTLAGLAGAGLAILASFVLPFWSEYSFYNWQMTVMRKPEYSLDAFVMRASWLPVVQSYFSRMWLIVVASAIVIAGVAAGWRAARPAERLLVLWVLLGLVELIVHDAGAERRYVMFIPAFVALTAILVGSRRSILPAAAHIASSHRWLLLPIFMLLAYLVVGSLVRQLFLDEIAAGNYRSTVRISAALAAVLGLWLVWAWPAVTRRLSTVQVPLGFVAAAFIIAVSWNLTQYVLWARVRGDLNYRASIEVGRQLAPGTLVHGKLANGLALENQIRPLFVGMGFGNYADRLRRDDARYILTYTSPDLGYESGRESGLIQELLNQYPTHRMVATFEVEETPGIDRATLIDKFPNRARD